jgi:hypothetical protein
MQIIKVKGVNMAQKIKMIGSGFSFHCTIISEDIASKIISDGTSEEKLEELLDDNCYESFYGCENYNLYVDDVEIELPEPVGSQTVNQIPNPGSDQWAIISIDYAKRYEFVIHTNEQKFEISKLLISNDRAKTGQDIYSVYSMEYAGIEADLEESVSNEQVYFIVDDQGNHYDFELIDQEEFDDDDTPNIVKE